VSGLADGPSTVGRLLGWSLAVLSAGLLVLAALGASQPAVGLVAAAGLLAAWATLAPPYAVAVGWVGLAATVPDAGVATSVLPVATAASLLLLLVVRDLPTPTGRRTAWLTLGLAGVLGGVAAATVGPTRIWLAAALVIGVGALVGYGVHRYERVALGVVDGG